jgi:membrane protease YdiL (CAAX protease family)
MIRRLPAGVEFLFVVTWAFGLPIFSSILSIGADPSRSTFDDSALYSIVFIELLQFGLLAWFLRVRGWTLEKFGLRVTWRGTAGGILLALVTEGVLIGAQYGLQLLAPHWMAEVVARYPPVSPDVSMHLVFSASVINGIYEELFVAGYIVTALTAARGTWLAINVSTVVRLLYHLYQGPMGVLTIVPMGFAWAYIYTRKRALWPLMLAHILIDIAGLVVGAIGR